MHIGVKYQRESCGRQQKGTLDRRKEAEQKVVYNWYLSNNVKMKRMEHYFATQCTSSMNTASILFFNVWESWTDDLQTKLRGLWTQGCICPLRLPCFHFLNCLNPQTLDHSLTKPEEKLRGTLSKYRLFRKRRDMKGKTFSWPCRRSRQNISTTEVCFYHLVLIFSDIFENLAYLNRSLWLLAHLFWFRDRG